MTYNYEELTEQDGMRTSITQETASSQAVYKLRGVNENTPPTISQLSGFPTYLMGSVDNLEAKVTTVGVEAWAGKVRRSPPKMHPFLPDVSVVGVPNMVPHGRQTQSPSLAVVNRTAITDQFPLYTHWDYTVEFARRPYPILADEEITLSTGTYVLPDGTSKPYRAADEWKRWTRFLLNPLPDTATSSYGGFKFSTASGTGPHNAEFIGQTYCFLENQSLDVEWYAVPKRYLENKTIGGVTYRSYLTRFVNRVNQFDWNGYPAGSLLYMGAQVMSVYRPPVPQVGGLFTGYKASPDECVNLRLRFIHTTREGTDVPVTPNEGLANANNIAAGHNLQPNFADRLFYYVRSTGPSPYTDETKWMAIHKSFPVELLFTDPLLTQPAGPI